MAKFGVSERMGPSAESRTAGAVGRGQRHGPEVSLELASPPPSSLLPRGLGSFEEGLRKGCHCL